MDKTNKVKPISPDEAMKKSFIPDGVFEIVNDLLEKDVDSKGNATITKDEIVKQIIKKELAKSETEIQNKHWLDIEPHYRAAGWEVEFDKPAYCEDYPSKFIFTKSKKKPKK